MTSREVRDWTPIASLATGPHRKLKPASMGMRKHTRAMPDYGSALQFGLSVTPETAHIGAISELVQLADVTGLDLVAIQDHAYNHTFLETWTLSAFLAAN